MSDASVDVRPSVRQVLDFLATAGTPKVHELPVEAARQMFEMMAPKLDMPEPAVARVEDRRIPTPGGERPVRIYWPRDVEPGGLPLLLFLHGGGWVIGSIATHDRVCRHLANAARAVVASLDYRLAPEHPFPAAVEDAIAAHRWAADEAAALGADPRLLFVAGDSAGGNLAAVTALAARDAAAAGEERPLKGQILLYPAVDLAGDYPSRARFAEGYFLETATMRWFVDRYVPDEAARTDWRVSPLRAADHAGLAPAMVLTAGLDPLRDEGAAYARRLTQAGVDVDETCYEGVIHGFLNMGGLVPEARQALDEVASWIAARV